MEKEYCELCGANDNGICDMTHTPIAEVRECSAKSYFSELGLKCDLENKDILNIETSYEGEVVTVGWLFDLIKLKNKLLGK